MNTSEIHLTKLASAERQLKSAIRMYFMEEDELAIHTIASAVYTVLTDIKKSRGQDEFSDILSKATERLSEAGIHLQIEGVSTAAPKKIEDRSSFNKVKKMYWQDTNKSANFLKHADRDARETLEISKVDNTTLLTKCMDSYFDIKPEYPGIEGYIYYRYVFVVDTLLKIPDDWANDPIVKRLQDIPTTELKNYCYQAIKNHQS